MMGNTAISFTLYHSFNKTTVGPRGISQSFKSSLLDRVLFNLYKIPKILQPLVSKHVTLASSSTTRPSLKRVWVSGIDTDEMDTSSTNN